MILSTQNITFQELSLLGDVELSMRKLSITFDTSSHVIQINNKYKPPISWFLTDNQGELVKLGQISDSNFHIDLSGIPLGVYSLRIAGEVHIINNLL